MTTPADPGAEAVVRIVKAVTTPTLWKPWPASLAAMQQTQHELEEFRHLSPWGRNILTRLDRWPAR
jgi:hypothetical protein